MHHFWLPRITRLTLVLAGFFIAAISVVSASRPPDRPGVARAAAGGKAMPVVAVRGKTPLVEIDGKRVAVDKPVRLSLDVAHSYTPGLVEFREPQAVGWYTEYSLNSLPFFDAPKASQFRTKLVSDVNLDDVYVIILVFEHRDSYDTPVECGIVTGEVGKLIANKPRYFSASFPPLEGRRRWAWSAAVFSGPRQVRSYGVSNMLPDFFDAVERYRYRLKLADRARGPDMPLAVFRQIPFRFSDDIRTKYSGQRISIRLRIDNDGRLLDFEVPELRDAELWREIHRSIEHWLFLPTIKEGRAVEDFATLPVRFESEPQE